MKQDKKQKSFGNSISAEKVDYPIVIEIPKNYWTYSKNIEYVYKEN